MHFLWLQMYVNSNSTLNFHSDHCICTQNIYWVNVSYIYKQVYHLLQYIMMGVSTIYVGELVTVTEYSTQVVTVANRGS